MQHFAGQIVELDDRTLTRFDPCCLSLEDLSENPDLIKLRDGHDFGRRCNVDPLANTQVRDYAVRLCVNTNPLTNGALLFEAGDLAAPYAQCREAFR